MQRESLRAVVEIALDAPQRRGRVVDGGRAGALELGEPVGSGRGPEQVLHRQPVGVPGEPDRPRRGQQDDGTGEHDEHDGQQTVSDLRSRSPSPWYGPWRRDGRFRADLTKVRRRLLAGLLGGGRKETVAGGSETLSFYGRFPRRGSDGPCVAVWARFRGPESRKIGNIWKMIFCTPSWVDLVQDIRQYDFYMATAHARLFSSGSTGLEALQGEKKTRAPVQQSRRRFLLLEMEDPCITPYPRPPTT